LKRIEKSFEPEDFYQSLSNCGNEEFNGNAEEQAAIWGKQLQERNRNSEIETKLFCPVIGTPSLGEGSIKG